MKPEQFIREYTTGKFQGDFPVITVSDRVDLSALTQGDDDPFYVTLPIARLNNVSENKMFYDTELVQAIEDQVVGKGGIMGHIKPEERDTAFPIEDVDWVGAARQGDTLFGKAYVPPGTTREYIRRLKARGGSLSTSIYGPYDEKEQMPDGSHRVRGFRLESLDLAPADRAALRLGGHFGITAQMESDTSEDDEGDMDKTQFLAELTAPEVPAVIREQIITAWQAEHDQEKQVAELTQKISDRDTVIAELQKQIGTYIAAEFDKTVDAKIDGALDWNVTGDDAKASLQALKNMLRGGVMSELGEDRKPENIDAAFDRAWEANKLLVETVRNALAGPPVYGGNQPGNNRKLDLSPENVQKEQATWGLGGDS